ncbi:MAG: hypothetical protein ACP5KS_12295, partial [Candidatus Hydrogenedens sp.]
MNNINDEIRTNSQNQQCVEIPSTFDYIFFIRRKKSFRYLIFSVVILTFCLWFSDRYLRFDLDETKYRVALTLEKESARPIMRNIVQKVLSNPTLLDDPRYSQYLEFLALIEEDDAVQKLFQDIYNLSNINTSFLTNYVTRLYFLGNYNKARDLIKEAQNLPLNNSLLGYIESAMVITPGTTDEKTLSEGISIIVKENRSGNPIIFPEPYWHNTLPKYTYSYYMQKYNILNHCLAPLYKMFSDILKQTETDLNQNNVQNKQIWLEELYRMGKKIGMSLSPDDYYSSLPICIFSLKLQKDILSTYNKFSKSVSSPILEKEKGKLNKISNLLEMSEQLEEKRKIEFENSRENRTKTIAFVLLGLIKLIFIYFISKLLYSLLFRSQPNLLFLMFPGSVYIYIFVWSFVVFVFLFYSLYFNKIIVKSFFIMSILWSLLLISPFFVLISSLFRRKLCNDVFIDIGKNKETYKSESKRKYSFLLLFIYFTDKLAGILLGFYTTLICILFLTFRIFYFSYPFQLNLIWDLTRIEE